MHKQILNRLEVSCGTIDKLATYVEVLLKWNKKINLISKNTVPNLWMRHIVDSAQIIAFVENKKQVIIDVGAGAGFPGMILRILGLENVILIESDERKTSFLREVARTLNLDLEIVNDRVEKIFIKSDIVVARGFSALDEMLDKVNNIEYSRMLLLKGKNVESEISQASKNWKFCYKKHESITSAGSYILDITNVRRREN